MRSLRPCPSLATSLVALFVALGGTSYAVATNAIGSTQIKNNSIQSKDIENNQVSSADIKNNQVSSADVKDKSLGAADFKPGQLHAGPAGARGPAGAAGATNVVVRSVNYPFRWTAAPRNSARSAIRASEPRAAV